MIGRYCLMWSLTYILIQGEVVIHRTGWLDRLVQYYKQKFVQEVHEKLPPIGFKVSLIKAPPGYVDSKDWDYDSVIRLLTLIHSNEKTTTLAKKLQRVLKPMMTRRLHMTKEKSYKFFPKKPSDVEIYYDDSEYDDDYDEASPQQTRLDDDTIIFISNPVESRLPRSHISVRSLREILEARADAARVMPLTKPTTIHWVPFNTTKTATSTASKPDDSSKNGDHTDATPAPNGGASSDAPADGASSPAEGAEAASDAPADAEGEQPPAEDQPPPERRSKKLKSVRKIG